MTQSAPSPTVAIPPGLDPLVDTLAQWTHPHHLCTNAFRDLEGDGDYRRYAYVCAEMVLRRLAAAVRDGAAPGGLWASDRMLRGAITCSCESRCHAPWTDLAERTRRDLRLRAARCVGACDLTADRLRAFQPCAAFDVEVADLRARLQRWAEETATPDTSDDHALAREWWARRRGRGPLQAPRHRRPRA